MRIEQFTVKKPRKVRGTDVKAGDTAYAIREEWDGLFFIWAYTDKEYAAKVSARLDNGDRKLDAMDAAANWRKTTDELTITNRNKD